MLYMFNPNIKVFANKICEFLRLKALASSHLPSDLTTAQRRAEGSVIANGIRQGPTSETHNHQEHIYDAYMGFFFSSSKMLLRF